MSNNFILFVMKICGSGTQKFVKVYKFINEEKKKIQCTKRKYRTQIQPHAEFLDV